MARICFLVPIVIVDGAVEERSCLKVDGEGQVGAGGLIFDEGYGWGFVSFETGVGVFERAGEEENDCTSPRSRKEFLGTWESLCLYADGVMGVIVAWAPCLSLEEGGPGLVLY